MNDMKKPDSAAQEQAERDKVPISAWAEQEKADKTRKSNIDADAEIAIKHILKEEQEDGDVYNCAQAAGLILHAIVQGKIPHITITY